MATVQETPDVNVADGMAGVKAALKGPGTPQEKCTNAIIDAVNPKFKAYNRPLCLACTIGPLTALAVIAVYSVLITNCVREEVIISDARGVQRGAGVAVYPEDGETANQFGACVIQVQKLTIVDGRSSDQKIEASQNVMINKLITTYTTCDFGPFTDGTYFGAGGFATDKPEYCVATDSYWPDDCMTEGSCSKCFDSISADGAHKIYKVQFSKCPDKATTFGAAMGYAAIIELFFTGFIIFPCVSLGCLKTGDESYEKMNLKSWLKAMNAGKGQLTEAGSAVGSVASGDVELQLPPR